MPVPGGLGGVVLDPGGGGTLASGFRKVRGPPIAGGLDRNARQQLNNTQDTEPNRPN